MKSVKILFAASFIAAMLLSFQQPFDLKASMERGKDVYLMYCATCHMMQGEGVEGVFPPMAKNANLAAKDRMVQIILKGMRGPMKANGKEYNTEMAPTVLSDQETADVLNYIRNSWGNKNTAIQPKDIQPALKVVVKGLEHY